MLSELSTGTSNLVAFSHLQLESGSQEYLLGMEGPALMAWLLMAEYCLGANAIVARGVGRAA
jgi:hypothetical protein